MKEYDEIFCNQCLCYRGTSCQLLEGARMWILTHAEQIGDRFFEDVAEEYPGAFRPFMMAWCEEFGGI